jgi:hypothetical protein
MLTVAVEKQKRYFDCCAGSFRCRSDRLFMFRKVYTVSRSVFTVTHSLLPSARGLSFGFQCDAYRGHRHQAASSVRRLARMQMFAVYRDCRRRRCVIVTLTCRGRGCHYASRCANRWDTRSSSEYGLATACACVCACVRACVCSGPPRVC